MSWSIHVFITPGAEGDGGLYSHCKREADFEASDSPSLAPGSPASAAKTWSALHMSLLYGFFIRSSSLSLTHWLQQLEVQNGAFAATCTEEKMENHLACVPVWNANKRFWFRPNAKHFVWFAILVSPSVKFASQATKQLSRKFFFLFSFHNSASEPQTNDP